MLPIPENIYTILFTKLLGKHKANSFTENHEHSDFEIDGLSITANPVYGTVPCEQY